ncbi:dienelactone hydrolase family protein [Haloechinothrix sp. YIM 98757]|uniref:Dienelactone hydrolase family protein n=1 Tax=Haloechinothrix aidingensis TaxID=2752311 RepID=A0A838A3M9_9PSEU|nr:dienelactone hydrolase family protein [Haloechinothrix aidingensis]MBA0125893.1 dienelactone hydrolase family protein [Haloechinothrix aidingensis]
MIVPLKIDIGAATVHGAMMPPDGADKGLVVFVHGSGSSRHSPRIRAMARGLQAEGFGALLLDLLSTHEERIDARTGGYRLDVEFLAARLVHSLDRVWLGQGIRAMPVGLLGSGRGAAVALLAAARVPHMVRAVVSHSGRPELAGAALTRVRAPTLFVVDEREEHLLELNHNAAALMVTHDVRTVPGAEHVERDAHTLEQVTKYAGDWFTHHVRW